MVFVGFPWVCSAFPLIKRPPQLKELLVGHTRYLCGRDQSESQAFRFVFGWMVGLGWNGMGWDGLVWFG